MLTHSFRRTLRNAESAFTHRVRCCGGRSTVLDGGVCAREGQSKLAPAAGASLLWPYVLSRLLR